MIYNTPENAMSLIFLVLFIYLAIVILYNVILDTKSYKGFNMVRTFIGISLEHSVVAEISQELSYLKHKFPNINWVKPQNIHITLKFLGNIEPNDLRGVFNKVDQIGHSVLPFALSIQSATVLPDCKRPRVVCAGTGMGTDEIVKLQKKVEECYDEFTNSSENKQYYPHVTLGRIKKPSYALGFEEYLSDLDNIDFGITDVDELVVYMSELGNNGAEYSPMYKIRLGE